MEIVCLENVRLRNATCETHGCYYYSTPMEVVHEHGAFRNGNHLQHYSRPSHVSRQGWQGAFCFRQATATKGAPTHLGTKGTRTTTEEASRTTRKDEEATGTGTRKRTITGCTKSTNCNRRLRQCQARRLVSRNCRKQLGLGRKHFGQEPGTRRSSRSKERGTGTPQNCTPFQCLDIAHRYGLGAVSKSSDPSRQHGSTSNPPRICTRQSFGSGNHLQRLQGRYQRHG
mmetsp:Transcript_9076/g.22504  ORF Transcript_9076/g.22504 Transcript_9076/m.22504 type:complete len:228 (-) Transcript_9076:2391-3074(-)